MQSLSVCMIVQNRANLLPITLESLGGIYDELIVVDGGSIDRTCEICLEYGATIIHSPWANDYAQQRNVYLKAVKTDWVFAIDSDEFIDKSTLYFLQLLKLRGARFNHSLFFLPRRWISPSSLGQYIVSSPHYPDGQARIFRPQGLWYKGRIHEVPSGAPRECQFLGDLGLYHLDLFVNSEEQRRKKVAQYASKNLQDGATDYYLPDVDSLQLEAWCLRDVLPTVQQQLRLLDPIAIAPLTSQISSISVVEFQSDQSQQQQFDRATLILFPNWSKFDELDFFELVELVRLLNDRIAQSSIYVLAYAGDSHHRLIQTIFTNVFTELLITNQIEVPQRLKVLILEEFDSVVQIVESNPTRLMLSNEDQGAIAKLEATHLPTTRLDNLRI